MSDTQIEQQVQSNPFSQEQSPQEDKKDCEDEQEKDINDELTLESMFLVYDKDAGTFLDVREIMDLNEDDF